MESFDNLTLPELTQKHLNNEIIINELTQLDYMGNIYNDVRIEKRKILSDLLIEQETIYNLVKMKNV
jgi:hypothetical protein